jgi:hypothetical protein
LKLGRNKEYSFLKKNEKETNSLAQGRRYSFLKKRMKTNRLVGEGIINCSAKKNKEEQFSSGSKGEAPGCEQAENERSGRAENAH